MGAGVATATASQIKAESAKPTSAASSSQKACRGIEMADHAKSQQKDRSRNRCQGNQGKIDSAVKALPVTAMVAAVKVVFVVFAHLRREAGDVVTPARQNFANDGINALTHTRLQLDRFHRLRLSCQHHPVVQQCLASPQGLFRCHSGEFGMVVELRKMRQHYV